MSFDSSHGLPTLEVKEVEEGQDGEEVNGGVEKHGIKQEKDLVGLALGLEYRTFEEIVLN
jgi:hypothetical protein